MVPIITHLLLIYLVCGIVNTSTIPDDLLDEYVRHVDDVNRISEKPNKLNQRSTVRRIGRDVPNQWTHSETLDNVGDVVLRWQPRHREILFRVEAKTKGYVAIGFSPDGGKENADIVLGWVDDHSLRAYLLDCHGVPDSQGSVPIKDEIDNYTLMRGTQNDTHTVIEFRRVLDTCDFNDYVLTGDTVVIIWAYHDIDPHLGAEMIYHGNKRGAQSVHLLGPSPIPKAGGANIRNWDVTLKNLDVINNMNTMYWCKIFKPPTLQHKHHIVGYEPLIGSNHSSFVHHMILHECELDASEDFTKWEQFSKQDGELCYGPNMPLDWEKCLTPLVAWAIGSKGENFPKHVGLPLTGRKSFYMLEVHFDNPSMKQARDTSGLRLHYSSELRENEGAILTTGIALSSLHFIPPYQKEYKTAGYCTTDCTKATFPKDGIHVVSVMLHSHLAGRKLKFRHIRGGKELAPLAQDDHYDFNYQQSRALSQDVIILPGDGLVTECTYSTVTRNKPTLGGYSTKEEMCLAFVLHYPRTELAGCYSMSPIKYFFENLGVKKFYGKSMEQIEEIFLHGDSTETHPVSPSTPTKPLFPYKPGDEMSPEANRRAIIALQNAKDYTIEGEGHEAQTMFDKLVIEDPEEFRNKSFMNHLQDIPYNESLITKKMEEYFYTGLHLTFCRKRDDSLAIKESIIKFPNFTVYADDNQIHCSFKLKRSPSSSSAIKFNFMTKSFVCLLLLQSFF